MYCGDKNKKMGYRAINVYYTKKKMILNYTNQQDKYVSEYIAEICNDEVIDVEQKIKEGNTEAVFSEKPYLLIADYKKITKLKSLVNMGITHFTGSKILYVIFIDENNKANHYLHSTLSKNICAVKNMVSFGVENFNGLKETEFADENAILKAKYLGSFIRDSIPLCNIGENEYPFRCFNQSTF